MYREREKEREKEPEKCSNTSQGHMNMQLVFSVPTLVDFKISTFEMF